MTLPEVVDRFLTFGLGATAFALGIFFLFTLVGAGDYIFNGKAPELREHIRRLQGASAMFLLILVLLCLFLVTGSITLEVIP